MTRLIIDENLSPSLAQALRESGHDAVHVNAAGLHSAPDDAIMAWAAAQQRVVVTHDRDFHHHLRQGGLALPSVIKIPQRGPEALSGTSAQASRLRDVLPALDHRLSAGSAVTLDRHGLLVEPLPLSSGRHRDAAIRSAPASSHEGADRSHAPVAAPAQAPTPAGAVLARVRERRLGGPGQGREPAL